MNLLQPIPRRPRKQTLSFRFVVLCGCDFGWMGLGYLSTALKKIDGVKVSARYYQVNDVDRAWAETVAAAPDVVGCPILCDNLLQTREFVQRTKPLLPDTHFTFGNKEATALPERIMEWCDQLDSLVYNEGEETVADLVERLMAGRPLDGCLGLVHRVEGRVVKNEPRPLVADLEDLGIADRSILPIDRSPMKNHEDHRVFPVFTARGCLAYCTFCDVAWSKRHTVRARSLEKVFDEIEMLIRDHGATYILFGDDSFEDGAGTPVERFTELADTIRKRRLNIRFFMSCRLETIKPAVVPIFRTLKAVGLDRMLTGLEAANEADLRLYGKRARMNDNIEGIELLRELKVPLVPGFIMFNPYSTFERLRENIDFTRRYGLLCGYAKDMISSRLLVANAAALTRKVLRDGLMKDGSLPVIDPIHGLEAPYQFTDRRVEHAWRALATLGQQRRFLACLSSDESEGISACLDGDAIHNANSFGYWLSDDLSPYRDDPDTRILSDLLERFRIASNDEYHSLFTRVLDLAESGETEIAEAMQSAHEQLHEHLISAWQEVEHQKRRIEANLRSLGALPIKNHYLLLPPYTTTSDLSVATA